MASDKIDIGIKLNLINWPVWSVRMLCGLRVKSLACTIREPGPDGIDRDKDDRARGFIGLWVEDYHLPTVESAASTFELWNTLKASYAGQSIANQLRLRKQLHDLKLGHGEPITKYVARAQAIAAALDAAKDPVRESELVRYILAGLPQEYAHYIAVVDINTATADLNVATVHNQLLLRSTCPSQTTPCLTRPTCPQCQASPTIPPTTPNTVTRRVTTAVTRAT